MTDRELRKLRREDLLQILIDQQRQNDEMAEALKRAEAELQDKRSAIQQAGFFEDTCHDQPRKQGKRGR